MIYLPAVLAALADAFVATGRITKFLTAEELGDPYLINGNHELALDVDGDFTWERVGKPSDEAEVHSGNSGTLGDTSSMSKKTKKNKAGKNASVRPSETKDSIIETVKADNEEPFMLNNLRLKVAKGAFVAIIGRIGSGKVIHIYCHREWISSSIELYFTSGHWRNAQNKWACGSYRFLRLRGISTHCMFLGYVWWVDSVCTPKPLDPQCHTTRKRGVWSARR